MRLNSYDEWTPLREVVVGSAENYTHHVRDLTFELFFCDAMNEAQPSYYPRLAGKQGETAPRVDVNRRYVEELIEDVEGMANALTDIGVTVHRPMSLPAESPSVATPAWESSVLPPLNVRDNTLILGDEIIETAPMMRSRYFETQLLKRVFQNYFDAGARWSVMPRPMMTDRSFDASWANLSLGNTELFDAAMSSVWDVGIEIMLDAAQCMRFGRDLLVNVATEHHERALTWLERHLDGKYRIHRLYRMTDSHIDSMLMPLREGTLLVRNQGVVDMLPRGLQRWDLIFAPEPDPGQYPDYDDDDLVLASPFIDLNVLPLGNDGVMVNDSSPSLIRVLEAAGFTTVPVRHRHRRLFGGGLHCFTLDTVRDGGMEEYFD